MVERMDFCGLGAWPKSQACKVTDMAEMLIRSIAEFIKFTRFMGSIKTPPNNHTVLNREKSTCSGGADDDATGGDGVELFGGAKPMALSSGGSLAGGSAAGTIRYGVSLCHYATALALT